MDLLAGVAQEVVQARAVGAAAVLDLARAVVLVLRGVDPGVGPVQAAGTPTAAGLVLDPAAVAGLVVEVEADRVQGLAVAQGRVAVAVQDPEVGLAQVLALVVVLGQVQGVDRAAVQGMAQVLDLALGLVQDPGDAAAVPVRTSGRSAKLLIDGTSSGAPAPLNANAQAHPPAQAHSMERLSFVAV